MSNTPHELAEEFPEHVQTMHELREKDAHFVKMADAYHAVNGQIHRAETDVEPTSDDHLVEMRKQRMALKDQINAYVTQRGA